MKNLKNIKLFLFDLDGTIYLGDKLLPGVNDLLNYFNENEISYKFLTNNSSKNRLDYYKKLKNYNLNLSLDQIITSGIATINYIKNINSNASVYLVGTNALKDEFEQNGLIVTSNIKENIDFLVTSYDTELDYKKLEDAVFILNNKPNVTFLATNPDILCPMENNTYLPDCGLITNMIEIATNKKATYIGKPRKEMIESIIGSTPKKHVSIVGDRLYTDILNGHNANVSSILVLTGETKIKDLNNSNIKPTYTFKDLKELLNNIKENMNK